MAQHSDEYSVHELAERLQIQHKSVNTAIRRGRYKAIAPRQEGNGRWYFNKVQTEAWIAKNRRRPGRPTQPDVLSVYNFDKFFDFYDPDLYYSQPESMFLPPKVRCLLETINNAYWNSLLMNVEGFERDFDDLSKTHRNQISDDITSPLYRGYHRNNEVLAEAVKRRNQAAMKLKALMNAYPYVRLKMISDALQNSHFSTFMFKGPIEFIETPMWDKPSLEPIRSTDIIMTMPDAVLNQKWEELRKNSVRYNKARSKARGQLRAKHESITESMIITQTKNNLDDDLVRQEWAKHGGYNGQRFLTLKLKIDISEPDTAISELLHCIIIEEKRKIGFPENSLKVRRTKKEPIQNSALRMYVLAIEHCTIKKTSRRGIWERIAKSIDPVRFRNDPAGAKRHAQDSARAALQRLFPGTGFRDLTQAKIEAIKRCLPNSERDPAYATILKKLLSAIGYPVDNDRPNNRTVSLSQPVNEDKDSSLYDFVPDQTLPNPYKIVEDKEILEIIQEAFSTLTTQEKRVISLRFGFESDREYSYEEIADKLGDTIEHIKQIEAEAMKKLRHHAIMKKLNGFHKD